MQTRIVPNLWFDGQAEEAAEFYCSLFGNSRITRIMRYTEAGPGAPGTVVTVEFELDGQPFVGINGGPDFTFDEAVSFQIDCASQEEVDHFWDRLTEGGQGVQCGWLKDRYGLSWQVVPIGLDDLLDDEDPERARRATEAMFGMVKLDLAAIRAAADGVPAA